MHFLLINFYMEKGCILKSGYTHCLENNLFGENANDSLYNYVLFAQHHFYNQYL